LIKTFIAKDIEVVIPSKKNRVISRKHDKEIYIAKTKKSGYKEGSANKLSIDCPVLRLFALA
jgi:hypothetical protein